MSSTELRIDATNGNPYTIESFKEVYGDGWQKVWDSSEVFNPSVSPPVFRVASPAATGSHKNNLSVDEIAACVKNVINDLGAISPPSLSPDEFPSLGGAAPAPASTEPPKWGPPAPGHREFFHYTGAIDDLEGSPPPVGAFQYKYGTDNHSTNEEFETLPNTLWDGNQNYIQPLEDDDTDTINWEKMIEEWPAERWREFGIKYFYGYVQQTHLLLQQMGQMEEDAPLGAWGDE